MEEAMKTRLRDKNIWMRGLYMLLFVIAYAIAETVLTFIVIFQFLAALFTGRVNEALLKFSSHLSAYIYEILRFITFNSETRPYPFGDFPDEPVGKGPWYPDPDTPADAEPPTEQLAQEPQTPESDQLSSKPA